MMDVRDIPTVPGRPDDSHKGTFGTVVVVGGSAMMIGAPALCAGAALRAGCGLAKIAAPAGVLPFCLAIEPSATGLRREELDTLDEKTVLAVGPGLGVGEPEQGLLKMLLRSGRPIVLDADGLNNLVRLPADDRLSKGPLVITPHPGEAKRLMDAAGLYGDPTAGDQRPTIAQRLREAYCEVVVLKGHRTVVTDASRCYVNTTGNAALATAGTGDVLTGLIASLVAQRMGPFEAAVLGVYLHGLAADLWAEEYGPSGLTAKMLIEMLPGAFAVHRAAG